jgi:hypothetical protein
MRQFSRIFELPAQSESKAAMLICQFAECRHEIGFLIVDSDSEFTQHLRRSLVNHQISNASMTTRAVWCD